MDISGHLECIESAPRILTYAGFEKEAEFLSSHLYNLKAAAISPDRDYSNFIKYLDLLPDHIRKNIPSTSPMKFEHFLFDSAIEKHLSYLKLVFALMHVKFRFADETIVDWYNQAKEAAFYGKIDSFIWHIGRCCHLVQDVCVPMHCCVRGSIKDVIDLSQHNQPNHNRFEKFCADNISSEDDKSIGLLLVQKANLNYDPLDALKKRAESSRALISACDGIKFDSKIFKILRLFGMKFNEDYKMAADQVNYSGKLDTAVFLHHSIKNCLGEI